MRKANFTKLVKMILLSALLCVSLSGCLLSIALGTRFVYSSVDLGGFFDRESKESVAVLMSDISSLGVFTIYANTSKVLDLNGHRLNCTPIISNTIITVKGELTIKDSGTGGIIRNEGSNCIINVASSGKLILECCSFESDNFLINVAGELVISQEMYNSIANKVHRGRNGIITIRN
jgi:hypothetical protein